MAPLHELRLKALVEVMVVVNSFSKIDRRLHLGVLEADLGAGLGYRSRVAGLL